MLSVKQGGIKYHFLSLWYEIEPQSPGPLANTLLIRAIIQLSFYYVNNFDKNACNQNFLATSSLNLRWRNVNLQHPAYCRIWNINFLPCHLVQHMHTFDFQIQLQLKVSLINSQFITKNKIIA